ncbi:uncharacterized protein LOC126678583 [Mercurialis annua]|uniref:uncharacterized protein LOC126678583 n=1 Tax=Mercurialis annua TaxID=3986 RepID=UPI00215F416C|nr:uncharacterized protein LOC126678583 [Mercurialis annua]
MELISTPLNRFWRRRRNRYEKLDGSGTRGRKNMKVIRFGGGDKSNSPPRRRGWRMKAVKKLKILKIACFYPLNLIRKVKNAYVNMMVHLSNDSHVFGNKRIPKARQASPIAYSNEEFETRMVYEIYKALKATQ